MAAASVAGSPVSAFYWTWSRDLARENAATAQGFWVERVIREIPTTARHTVVMEPVQPLPVSVEACRLGPLSASGRLSADAQSVQVALFGSVELEFRDADGQKHRRRHPFVVRRDVPGRDLPAAAGVRVAAAGRLVDGQMVKNGPRPAYRAHLELLTLVHLTQAVLRLGIPGDPSPHLIPLPVQRLSQKSEPDEAVGDLASDREDPEDAHWADHHQLPGESAPFSPELSPDLHPDRFLFTPPDSGGLSIQGLLEAESGYRLSRLKSALDPGGASLQVRALAESPDGRKHAETFLIPLAAGDAGGQGWRWLQESLQPHPHLPGYYLHRIHVARGQQRDQAEAAPPAVHPGWERPRPQEGAEPGKPGETGTQRAREVPGANPREPEEQRHSPGAVPAGDTSPVTPDRRPGRLLVWRIPAPPGR